MYIIVSSDINKHCEITALGHEIHMSRYMLCQLLHNKIVNENDTIVTRTEDRRILYTKMFRNVLTHALFKNQNISNENILDLTYFMKTNIRNFPLNNEIISSLEKKFGFNFNNLLYGEHAEDVNYLLNSLDFISIDQLYLQHNFIMIHTRIVNMSDHTWGKTDNIQNIINKIEKCDYTIICYVADSQIRYTSKKNIIYISDFSLYCSLMNHELCKAVISEISGGGEVSQYCHHKDIYIYSDRYDFGEPVLHKKLNDKIRPKLYTGFEGNEGSTNAILHKFPSCDLLIDYICREWKLV